MHAVSEVAQAEPDKPLGVGVRLLRHFLLSTRACNCGILTITDALGFQIVCTSWRIEQLMLGRLRGR